MQSGRPLRAKPLFQEAIDGGSTDPNVYHKFASLLAKDDAARASELWKKAIELGPLNGEYYMALGRALKKSNAKECERLTALALEIDPELDEDDSTSNSNPMHHTHCAALLFLFPTLAAAHAGDASATDAWIAQRADRLKEINQRIWSLAEVGLEERDSSALLASFLEGEGFRVTRGVADMPTAFVAERGSGRPIIGILAGTTLPGTSQQATPERMARADVRWTRLWSPRLGTVSNR
jgi:tetratricopeptide (TPR) repeat protein